MLELLRSPTPPIPPHTARSADRWPGSHCAPQMNKHGPVCWAHAALNAAHAMDLPGVEEITPKELFELACPLDDLLDSENRKHGIEAAPVMGMACELLDGRNWCWVPPLDIARWVLSMGPVVVSLRWHYQRKACVGWRRYFARRFPVRDPDQHTVTVMGFREKMKTALIGGRRVDACLVMDPMQPNERVWIGFADLIRDSLQSAAIIPRPT
jgi:hypothetical protein